MVVTISLLNRARVRHIKALERMLHIGAPALLRALAAC